MAKTQISRVNALAATIHSATPIMFSPSRFEANNESGHGHEKTELSLRSDARDGPFWLRGRPTEDLRHLQRIRVADRRPAGESVTVAIHYRNKQPSGVQHGYALRE